MNKKVKIQGNIILLITAFIWGTAFVAQSSGMENIPPLTFNALRSLLAVITLTIFLLIRNKTNKTKKKYCKIDKKNIFKKLFLPGLLCGLSLTVATNVQQFGILYSSVGKAGFITSLYIIFVPIIGVFIGKKIGWNIWISVFVSMIGFYLLSFKSANFSIELGDALLFIGSLFFAIQILFVDKYINQIDGIILSAMQFIVVFIVTIIPALIFEKPNFGDVTKGLGSLAFAGVLSSGVAYTLQIIGQKRVEPTIASLILSLESVIAAIAGIIILGESFVLRETIGCILLFGAVIFSQLQFKKKNSLFPKEINEFVKNLKYIKNEQGRSADEIYLFEDKYVLKISNDKDRLLREKTKTDWIAENISAAKTIIYLENNGLFYYLRTYIKGDTLISKRFISNPNLLISVLVDVKNVLRSLDNKKCPFKSLDNEGNDFVHGDLCLPNILVDEENNFLGFIDLDNAGLGDKWYDYAWLLWSFEYNIKTNKYSDLLFKSLDLEMTKEKYEKYIPKNYRKNLI